MNHSNNISGSASAIAAASELSNSEDANVFINVFTEDILPKIFDNLEILTARDLLRFRKVNRCWRDAATSVLLKRNLCQIALNFGKVDSQSGKAFPERKDASYYCENIKKNPRFYKFFNVYQPTSFLSHLSQLISTSPEFPSTSLRFHSECWKGFRNLLQVAHIFLHQFQKDLLHFFSLYGKKIKYFSLCSGIEKTSIQNLLLVHMPHLICLNLEKFDSTRFSSSNQPGSTNEAETQVRLPMWLPPLLKLEIKELVLGYHSKLPKSTYFFVRELISVSPYLSAIKNVDVASLELLLEMETCHLIQDLHFDPGYHQMSILQQFSKFLTGPILEGGSLPRRVPINLNLRKLTVQFNNIWEWEYNTKYDVVVKALNIILSASKDSLKYLRLHTHPSLKFLVNISIPPLPHLATLRLDDFELSTSLTRATGARELTADESVCTLNLFNFQNTTVDDRNNIIPAGYFSRLRKVKLCMKKLGEDPCKLMEFFSLENITPGDVLSTVTNLEWFIFPLYNSTVVKLFPNVTHLQIHCEFLNSLQNWVWSEFKNLESFEIYGLGGGCDTKIVDSFFTGMTPELCAKLEQDSTCTALELDVPQVLVERTIPYIGDCENLKELKINIGRKWKFASKVTGVHGFEKVIHRTKIVFVVGNIYMHVEEIEELKQELKLVFPYVEVQLK